MVGRLSVSPVLVHGSTAGLYSEPIWFQPAVASCRDAIGCCRPLPYGGSGGCRILDAVSRRTRLARYCLAQAWPGRDTSAYRREPLPRDRPRGAARRAAPPARGRPLPGPVDGQPLRTMPGPAPAKARAGPCIINGKLPVVALLPVCLRPAVFVYAAEGANFYMRVLLEHSALKPF